MPSSERLRGGAEPHDMTGTIDRLRGGTWMDPEGSL
jgi:hypothetical protein